MRCANFSVDALRSAENEKSRSHSKSAPSLPIITSDKKTFNIPDDVYNPAFQISMTLYHYPDKCGTKFLREFKSGNSSSLCVCVSVYVCILAVLSKNKLLFIAYMHVVSYIVTYYTKS